jgi:hypothetical protein
MVPRRLRTGTASRVGLLVLLLAAAIVSMAPAVTAARAPHFICSGPASATVPCRFSTPSGNIRCLWTPAPESIACELLSSRRAYRLHPTGHARRISLALARRGQSLPLTQQLVFPNSLSCRDTRLAMICNQDFGLGSFTLAPHHSHAS